MYSEDEAPHNVYAKHLFASRHGYPLWHPEIEGTRGLEIKIGDVGFLQEGEFIRIFNATLGADHEDHIKFGVPSGHKPFDVKTVPDRRSRAAVNLHVCSRSVSCSGLPVAGESVAAEIGIPAGTVAKFRCSNEQGAFVFTNAPAKSTQILASRTLARFIRENVDRWHQHAEKQLDLQIDPEQILFVSGVTKAADWGLGAFVSQARGGEVAFTAKVPFIRGAFSVQKENAPRADIEYRARPLPVDDSGSIESPRRPSANIGVKRDQTLFIHYYKTKARSWINSKRAVEAATGSEEGDPDLSGDGEDVATEMEMDDEGEVVQEPPIDQAYDPVDYLLDYILDYPLEDGTEVQVAIASDLHIYALFDGEIPMDIKEQLEQLRPPVMFVDDNREVACLAIAEWAEELPEGNEAESEGRPSVIICWIPR
ncbi:hypothetical protein V8D89_008577 [Ganoderma adspersum]